VCSSTEFREIAVLMALKARIEWVCEFTGIWNRNEKEQHNLGWRVWYSAICAIFTPWLSVAFHQPAA